MCLHATSVLLSISIFYFSTKDELSTGPSASGSASGASANDVVAVQMSFFKSYQGLFDAFGDPENGRGMNIAAQFERKAVDAIQDHFDNAVVALHASCDLTDKAYQALINYTSNVWEDRLMKHLLLPFGTPMAKWMSKNKLKEKLAEISEELGIEIKPGSAWLDPSKVIKKRVEELVALGLLDPKDLPYIKV